MSQNNKLKKTRVNHKALNLNDNNYQNEEK